MKVSVKKEEKASEKKRLLKA
jgi:hypothetical protein